MGWGAQITPLHCIYRAKPTPARGDGGSEMGWVLLKEEGTS